MQVDSKCKSEITCAVSDARGVDEIKTNAAEVADGPLGLDNRTVRTRFGVVAIGRNEGERLRRCLSSLSSADVSVYVDSGSTDGSPQVARKAGLDVVDLDMTVPFTAARARNAGFWRLRQIAPDLQYVQFLDGDCELIEDWPTSALTFLEENPEIGAVCGWRRELYPGRSVYNRLCERDWGGAVGQVTSCGGDVIMRTAAFEAVGGYRADLIAGEDPEICIRMRAAGWSIWRLDIPMTRHDAALSRFSQWWRRAVRAGYAFAEGAYLHGASPERHWVWQSCRAWLVGFLVPLSCLMATLVFPPWGLTAWLIYPAYTLEKFIRLRGRAADRAVMAIFDVLVQFPYALGQIKFILDRLLRRKGPLIEYK